VLLAGEKNKLEQQQKCSSLYYQKNGVATQALSRVHNTSMLAYCARNNKNNLKKPSKLSGGNSAGKSETEGHGNGNTET
jgi:hypothetical protein